MKLALFREVGTDRMVLVNPDKVMTVHPKGSGSVIVLDNGSQLLVTSSTVDTRHDLEWED